MSPWEIGWLARAVELASGRVGHTSRKLGSRVHTHIPDAISKASVETFCPGTNDPHKVSVPLSGRCAFLHVYFPPIYPYFSLNIIFKNSLICFALQMISCSERIVKCLS